MNKYILLCYKLNVNIILSIIFFISNKNIIINLFKIKQYKLRN